MLCLGREVLEEHVPKAVQNSSLLGTIRCSEHELLKRFQNAVRNGGNSSHLGTVTLSVKSPGDY